MKRTALERRTPLARRVPVPRVSKRRLERDGGYPQARRDVFERAGGVCEAHATDQCRGWVPLLGPWHGHAHHIGGRGGPDPHRLANLLWLCADCHAWIHEHPAVAYERGWMRPRT